MVFYMLLSPNTFDELYIKALIYLAYMGILLEYWEACRKYRHSRTSPKKC